MKNFKLCFVFKTSKGDGKPERVRRGTVFLSNALFFRFPNIQQLVAHANLEGRCILPDPRHRMCGGNVRNESVMDWFIGW